MDDVLREHYEEKDREYWLSGVDVVRYIEPETVLRYARDEDADAFFGLLIDNAGIGRDLDDLLDSYLDENRESIEDYEDRMAR